MTSQVPESRSAPRRLVALAGVGGLLGIGALRLGLSWGHWPDVLIDFGRELYLPWRLSEGEVLYRDLAHLSGPLSAYWNALVFRVFGVGLDRIVWSNVALVVALTALLHRLLARIAGPFSAFAGAALFLSVFAFCQVDRIANYNYVTPYAHELTHGLLLGLACLLAAGSGRPRLAGLLLGAVALTKLEILVAVLAALAALLALELRATARRGALRDPALARRWRRLLVGAAIAPLTAWGLLSLAMPAGEALRALADPWLFALDPRVRGLAFYRWGMGTLRPWESLDTIGRWSAFWMLGIGGASWLALRVRLAPRAATTVAALLALASFLACYALGPRERAPWLWAATPLPLACAGWLLFEARRLWSLPPAQAGDRERLRFAFVVLATALSAKIALRAVIHHYGFALSMPIAMVGVAALCDWIPRRIDARGGCGALVRGVGVGALAMIVVAVSLITRYSHERQPVRVGAPPDALLTDVRGRYVNALIAELGKLAPPGSTLLVLPEGVMINYLTRMRNPTPYLNFMPPEVLLFGEERMRAAFERQPPDFVALVHKSTHEYGVPFFGVDYGRSLRAFVDRHYRPLRLIGDMPLTPDTDFGIQLLRREAPTPGAPRRPRRSDGRRASAPTRPGASPAADAHGKSRTSSGTAGGRKRGLSGAKALATSPIHAPPAARGVLPPAGF